jgi:hypothetical protein
MYVKKNWKYKSDSLKIKQFIKIKIFTPKLKSNVFKCHEEENTSLIDKTFVFHFGFDIQSED